MKKETADAICQALDEQGAEYERRDTYSGRTHYGRLTVGIVVGDIGTFIGAVARAAARLEAEEKNYSHGTGSIISDFIKDVRRVSFDQMGKSDIVVY